MLPPFDPSRPYEPGNELNYNNSFSGTMHGFGPNFFQGHTSSAQWNDFPQHTSYHHPPWVPPQYPPPPTNIPVPWNAGPSNYHPRPYQSYNNTPYNNKSEAEQKQARKRQKKKLKRKRRQERKRKQAEDAANQLEARMQILTLQDPTTPPPHEGEGKGKAVDFGPAAENNGPDSSSSSAQDKVEKKQMYVYHSDQRRLCEYYIPHGDAMPIMCERHGVRCEYFADPLKSLRSAPVRRLKSMPPM